MPTMGDKEIQRDRNSEKHQTNSEHSEMRNSEICNVRMKIQNTYKFRHSEIQNLLEFQYENFEIQKFRNSEIQEFRERSGHALRLQNSYNSKFTKLTKPYDWQSLSQM